MILVLDPIAIMSSTSSSTSSPRPESPVAAAPLKTETEVLMQKGGTEDDQAPGSSMKTDPSSGLEAGIDRLLQRHRK